MDATSPYDRARKVRADETERVRRSVLASLPNTEAGVQRWLGTPVGAGAALREMARAGLVHEREGRWYAGPAEEAAHEVATSAASVLTPDQPNAFGQVAQRKSSARLSGLEAAANGPGDALETRDVNPLIEGGAGSNPALSIPFAPDPAADAPVAAGSPPSLVESSMSVPDQILAFVGEHPGATNPEIVAAVPTYPGAVSSALSRLVRQGRLMRVGGTVRGAPAGSGYRYSVAAPVEDAPKAKIGPAVPIEDDGHSLQSSNQGGCRCGLENLRAEATRRGWEKQYPHGWWRPNSILVWLESQAWWARLPDGRCEDGRAESAALDLALDAWAEADALRLGWSLENLTGPAQRAWRAPNTQRISGRLVLGTTWWAGYAAGDDDGQEAPTPARALRLALDAWLVAREAVPAPKANVLTDADLTTERHALRGACVDAIAALGAAGIGVDGRAIADGIRALVADRDQLRVECQAADLALTSLGIDEDEDPMLANGIRALAKQRDNARHERDSYWPAFQAATSQPPPGWTWTGTRWEATDQPAPNGGEGDCWAELIARLPEWQMPSLIPMCSKRREVGIARYGQPLRRGDGRNNNRDFCEELLDAAVYAWKDGAPDLARTILILIHNPKRVVDDLGAIEGSQAPEILRILAHDRHPNESRLDYLHRLQANQEAIDESGATLAASLVEEINELEEGLAKLLSFDADDGSDPDDLLEAVRDLQRDALRSAAQVDVLERLVRQQMAGGAR